MITAWIHCPLKAVAIRVEPGPQQGKESLPVENLGHLQPQNLRPPVESHYPVKVKEFGAMKTFLGKVAVTLNSCGAGKSAPCGQSVLMLRGLDGGVQTAEGTCLENREADWPLTATGILMGNLLHEALFSALDSDSGEGEASWCPVGLKAGVWPPRTRP